MRMYEESLRLLDERKNYLNPRDYNIVFMGDSWVGENGYSSNDIFESAMQEAKKYKPLFIIHGGDIVYTGKKENFEFFRDFKNRHAGELPFFVSVGNHEAERLPSGQSLENFENMISPLHFTLNVPMFRLTLISLNALYHNVYKQYGLTDTELDYLRYNVNRRFQNTFITMHVPPKTDKWINPNEVFIINSERFFDMVGYKVSQVLVSHVHAFDTDKYRHTKLILSGGGGATLSKKQIHHIVVFNIKNTYEKSKIYCKVVPIGWE